MVDLGYVKSVSHETIRQVLKKELKPWRNMKRLKRGFVDDLSKNLIYIFQLDSFNNRFF